MGLLSRQNFDYCWNQCICRTSYFPVSSGGTELNLCLGCSCAGWGSYRKSWVQKWPAAFCYLLSPHSSFFCLSPFTMNCLVKQTHPRMNLSKDPFRDTLGDTMLLQRDIIYYGKGHFCCTLCSGMHFKGRNIKNIKREGEQLWYNRFSFRKTLHILFFIWSTWTALILHNDVTWFI